MVMVALFATFLIAAYEAAQAPSVDRVDTEVNLLALGSILGIAATAIVTYVLLRRAAADRHRV
jgi:hypothetical protein